MRTQIQKLCLALLLCNASLAAYAQGNATISWTPNTPGFVLQETVSLSPTNWVNSTSDATNPIVVPTPLPARVYRLFKP